MSDQSSKSKGPQEAPYPDALIDRLYEVAVDPSRYEALLDHWEAMIAPQRAAANARGAAELKDELERFEGHFRRADAVLDRAIRDRGAMGPSEALREMGSAAGFAVDRAGILLAVNPAAARAFGVAPGAHIRDLVLAEGEAETLARRAARLFLAHDPAPTVLRSHAEETGRVVLFNLRRVAPGDGPRTPFVLIVSSELGWSEEFEDLLCGAFDLTRAEAHVLRGLAEGAGPPQIAAARGRSVATVRAQIKSIMAKTETRSQSELVRLTLSTMEMARLPEPETSEADLSAGFGTLEPRPFRTLTLPDGRRLDYLILGDPGGAPLLFLPLDYGLVRWPAGAEAEAARRGIRIVVPVRPGYGASTPLPRKTPYIPQLCEDLGRLLDHLGIASLPVLSLGSDSFIAIALHANLPERVRALVACAGVLPLTRPEQYERMHKWHRFILAGARYTPHLLPFMVKAGFALARRAGKRAFVHAVYADSAADVATFEIPEVFEAMVCGSDVALSETHSAHDAFAREVIAHETTDHTDEVAALRGSVPVHFLNGLQDPQVPPETLAEFREDYPWIDFTVYPDAGQLLFFLKWRDALAKVMPYLDAPRRRDSPSGV